MKAFIKLSLAAALAVLVSVTACKEEDPSFGEVKFQLKDASNQNTIIEGATFTLSEDDFQIKPTNIEGEYTTGAILSGTELNFKVTSASKNYFDYNGEVIIPEGTVSDEVLFLQPKPKILVSCFEISGNTSLADVTLELLDIEGNVLRSGRSSLVGIFQFTQLAEEKYVIFGKKEGYKDVIKHVDILSSENPIESIVLNFEPLAPVLNVSVTSLDFGAFFPQLPIEIRNSGEGPLMWEIIESENWLSANPTSGTLNVGEVASANITVNRDLLNQGNFSSSISVQSDGGSATINVIGSVVSQLIVEPTDLDFSTNLDALSFSIRNGGAGNIDYQVEDDQDWITLSDNRGNVSNEVDPIQVFVKRNSLSPGNYTGKIFVSSTTGGNATVVASMTIRDFNNPQMTLSESTLDFGKSSVSKVLTIANTGNGDLDWSGTVSSGINWVTLSNYAGTLKSGESASVNVSVIRNGLSTGNHEARVDFSSNGGNEFVDIKMEVNNNPELSINPDLLDFGPDVEQLFFDISNQGNGQLTWTANPVQAWISVNPRSGTGDANNIVVTVNRNALSVGPHAGTVSILSNGGDRSLDVRMSKSPPPPNLVLQEAILISDDNSSGDVSPGESPSYNLTITNDNGQSNALSVTASFSSTSPYVLDFNNTNLLNYGDISINQEVTRTLKVRLSPDAPINQPIPITVTLKDGYGVTWNESFDINVVAPFVVPNGLLAYYRYNDLTADDEFGNYNGILFGPNFSPDTPDGTGYSIEYNRDEKDYYQMPLNFLAGRTTYTFNTWVKFNENHNGIMYFFSSALSGSNGNRRITIANMDKISFGAYNYNDGGFVTPLNNQHYLQVNTWHMITLVLQSYDQRLYIDGKLVELRNDFMNSYSNPGFSFGYRTYRNTSYFNGKMDNVRFYNRLLSQNEINTLYQARE